MVSCSGEYEREVEWDECGYNLVTCYYLRLAIHQKGSLIIKTAMTNGD